MKWSGSFILLLLICLSISGVQGEPVDSTQVRKTEKIKKNFGQQLLSVPQFLINVPIRILGGTTKLIINQAYIGSKKIAYFKRKKDRKWVISPVIDYSSNPGLIGGLSYKTHGVFSKNNDKLKISASYSTNEYQDIKIGYSAPNAFNEKAGITFSFYYKNYSRESLYGLGKNSNNEDEVAFSLEDTYLKVGGLWNLYPTVSLNIFGSYRITNLYDGEDPNLEGDLDTIRSNLNLSMLETRASRYWSISPILVHDWRNSHGQPSRGGIESLLFSYNKGFDKTEDLQFTITKIDLRHYINIYRKRILALRVMAQSIDTHGDSPYIPFYLRSALGGKENLRGYRTRRYLDNDMAMVSIEYRYPIWDVVDAFIFFDEGQVFEAIFDDFNTRNWNYDAGGGIRIWNTDKAVLSISAAYSEEDIRFYFQFSDTF